MSTQLRFGACDPNRWKAQLPNLQPGPYLAGLNPLNDGRPFALCKDQPRREDRLPQSYGSGVPRMQSSATDHYGLYKNSDPNFTVLSTPEGPLKLPVQFQESHYTPSVATLDAVTHLTDTRLQAHPPRYYR